MERAVLALLLGLLTCRSCAQPANSTALQVCTATMTAPRLQNPMSLCKIDGDPSTYTGYDIEVWREIGRELGWQEGEDYAFRCMYFRDLLTGVKNGSCDVGLGAITVSTSREEEGYMFSYPTYASSLGVMVAVEKGGSDGFFFIKPFAPSVWLAIGLTLLFFPALLWLTDSIIHKGRFRNYPGRYNKDGLAMVYNEVSWLAVLNGAPTFDSTAVRLMLLSFGVLVVVLLNVYLAQLAAFLTIGQFKSKVNSLSDLKGKAVGATPVYQTRLLRASLVPAVYGDGWAKALGTGADGDWISHIRSGALTAFVHDEPLLRSIDAIIGGCDVRLLDETLDQFNYAFIFPNTTLLDLEAINDVIQKLQEQGVLAQLRGTYIATTVPACKKDGGGQVELSISFSQLWGIWVIFAGGIVVSLVLAGLLVWGQKTVVPALSRRFTSHRSSMMARQTLSRGASALADAAGDDKSIGSSACRQDSSQLPPPGAGGEAFCGGPVTTTPASALTPAGGGAAPGQFAAQIEPLLRQQQRQLEEALRLLRVAGTGERGSAQQLPQTVSISGDLA